jgi:TonB family protein
VSAAGRYGHPDGRPALAVPLGVSAALHLTVAAALLLARPDAPRPLPPVYKVDLVAAPPGPRAIGVVNPPPAPTPPVPQAPPPRPQTAPTTAPLPGTKASVPARTPPRAATPVPQPSTTKSPSPAPAAGGGPTGGTGADVATIRTAGIEFPYPGYLSNIVRQIALRFQPDDAATSLRADVYFRILRNGTVTDIRIQTRSGNYAFDLEAQGAIEAAARSFGPLPAGFTEDALPVIFSFDPRLLR